MVSYQTAKTYLVSSFNDSKKNILKMYAFMTISLLENTRNTSSAGGALVDRKSYSALWSKSKFLHWSNRNPSIPYKVRDNFPMLYSVRMDWKIIQFNYKLSFFIKVFPHPPALLQWDNDLRFFVHTFKICIQFFKK